MNDINIGLWKTKSEKTGTSYYRGSKNGVEINGKMYKTTLFMNSNKKTDKSPDMTIKLTEIKQDSTQESIQEVPQNIKTEYQDNEIVLEDKDLPF